MMSYYIIYEVRLIIYDIFSLLKEFSYIYMKLFQYL